MKYLPFENITYITKLNSQEIQNRLNQNIESKKRIRFNGIFGNKNHKPYEGSIIGNTFKINRIISYENSFLPTITGIIEQNINGTKINVKMRLQIAVIVFMIVWFGGFGVGCFLVTSNMLANKSFEGVTLLPFGMLCFGYALTTGGFKYESIKSKKYLAKLFEAEIEK